MAGATISPASATVTQGGDATFTITPDAGKNIVEVRKNGVPFGTGNVQEFNNVQANQTLEVFVATPDTSTKATFAKVNAGSSSAIDKQNITLYQGGSANVKLIGRPSRGSRTRLFIQDLAGLYFVFVSESYTNEQTSPVGHIAFGFDCNNNAGQQRVWSVVNNSVQHIYSAPPDPSQYFDIELLTDGTVKFYAAGALVHTTAAGAYPATGLRLIMCNFAGTNPIGLKVYFFGQTA